MFLPIGCLEHFKSDQNPVSNGRGCLNLNYLTAIVALNRYVCLIRRHNVLYFKRQRDIPVRRGYCVSLVSMYICCGYTTVTSIHVQLWDN